MILNLFRNKLLITATAIATAFALDSCSMIYDDLPECPAALQIKFVYNYNLERAEAFTEQVHSVYVWAFDADGHFVWAGSEAGEALKDPDYVMSTPLGEGTYDFVAWCGLDGNDDFALGTYTPASKEELEIKLRTETEDGENVSSSHFPALFHGYTASVTHTIDPYKPSITTATMRLMKDTNDIAVMLHNIDGTAMDTKDFTVKITYADSWLQWDNAVADPCPLVTYKPWSWLYGQTTISKADETSSVLSTLLYEFSSSRLIEDGVAYLDVIRNTDGVNIIHIPLIEYFLYAKGNRWDIYTDQEYLDRCSDYSVLFFLDSNLNYYTALGIYINGWAVVPPQTDIPY